MHVELMTQDSEKLTSKWVGLTGFCYAATLHKDDSCTKRTVKKADIVRFGRTPPKTGKKRTFVV